MIVTFATFDVLGVTTPLKRFLPSVAAVVAAAVLAPLPALSILAAVALMVLLAPQTFAADERGRLDALYATLPISRRTVVTGRYVALVALYLALAAVATVSAVAATLAQGRPVSFTQLALVNLVCLVLFLLVIAVQLPFFFGLGFTRARPMMYIPLVVVSAGVWLADRVGLQDRLDVGALADVHPAAVAVPLALVLAAVVTLSAAVAATRYGRRSL